MITSDVVLSNMLRRIVLAPNSKVLKEVFTKFHSSFENGFPFAEIKITRELTQHILLASKKVRRMEDCPKPLQDLIQRLRECLNQALQINPILSYHLQNLLGDAAIESSCIDNFLSAVKLSGDRTSYSDIFTLLCTEWGGMKGGSIDVVNIDYINSICNFYLLIDHAARLKAGTQSSLWSQCGLSLEGINLSEKLAATKNGALKPPTATQLEELKSSGQTLYIPIGYANPNFFSICILAINYDKYHYRLRLLTADNKRILAAGNKQNHYCPEVIWEGLQIDQLTLDSFWKPLLEPATLTYSEQTIGTRNNELTNFLSFESTHLVPWFIKHLGKQPSVRHVEIEESCWINLQENQFRQYQSVFKSFKDSPENDHQKDLLLKPTGKEIKRTFFNENVFKFVNLLPLDLIPSEKNRLLFKAESRLLLLTGAYSTLLNGNAPLPVRGKFLRLIELSLGKVTAPIEKLMSLDPSVEQREAARILLVSILDLKHRLACYVRSGNHIQLTAQKSLYPSTNSVHHLNLSGLTHIPVKHTLFDAMRLNEGEQPLPYRKQWTAKCFPELHSSLARWYDLLLDAKLKCEPAEIITLAHRNIFSKLPIPSTNNIEDTFPDELSEGLQVGTLLLLKKISSLVTSEVYSEALVPPVFVADMAKVYRFTVELYRHLNPQVRKMPISWFSLHQYLQSRNSFHIPGEFKDTLEAIANSFKLISPKGHLRPSDDFREIPLFLMSWKEYPKHYAFHRKSLGPSRLEHRSVEEVLTRAELADSIGLKPEETSSTKLSTARWDNSFGGQCLLALDEIAQYHNMSIFAKAKAYQKALNDKFYRDYDAFENLGPEDHFQLEPPTWNDFHRDFNNRFGGHDTKYNKQVTEGKPPMTHRMVCLNDKQIHETISDLPTNGVNEWREQADLIKALPKRTNLKGTYQLHQAASGPSTLSLDVLLEFFEVRPALLLSLDYRSYFWAIFTSADVLEKACKSEPLLLNRLYQFIHELYKEDVRCLATSNLNFERLLWLSALTRHLCRLNSTKKEIFCRLLGCIMQDLCKFSQGHASEGRLAPHLLASQQFLSANFRLTLPEIGRLHVLMGRNPPTDPNDILLWHEASEAMQSNAPAIQAALISGDDTTRRELWSVIFKSQSDVQNAMTRHPSKISLTELGKTAAQMEHLKLKQNYLQQWSTYWQKKHWRSEPWRESAANRSLKIVDESIHHIAESFDTESASLQNITEELFLCTESSLLIKMHGRMISVDWLTGRITGEGNLCLSGEELATTAGNRVPIHLRKHPNLAPLKNLMLRKNVMQSSNGIVHFREIPDLRLNTLTGEARLNHEGYSYRLLAPSQVHSIGLPDQLREGFSVWISDHDSDKWLGILVAHSDDGTPHPILAIDRESVIRPLHGNTHLRLASGDYYPEVALFSRWGIEQKHILTWLDEDNDVAELYLPLNVAGSYTRISRENNGTWKIEGLDLQLEETNEAVAAFAGHSVYLVAKNAEGQRILLLPGATPYEIQERKKVHYHEVDWNHIFSSKPKEGIYQYRILPSGQVEGLTVADNLLLMLWTVYMGHYSATAELAKRWLNPPGRPYTPDEERILLNWVRSNGHEIPLQGEAHPSVQSLRLYVIVQIARHMRNFPSTGKNEKKISELCALFTDDDSFDRILMQREMLDNLMDKGAFRRQIKATKFQKLLSSYDHEAIIRLLRMNDRDENTSVIRGLYQRQNDIPTDQEIGSTEVTCSIYGRPIYQKNPELHEYYFNDLISTYPTISQIDKVPVETLYRSIVQTNLIHFFDKAYHLIKNKPSNKDEDIEYQAILHALRELRGPKLIDLCIHYYTKELNYYHEIISEKDIMLWLILEQALVADQNGEQLPELPSIERRFGLTLQGSEDATKKFFAKLLSFSGMNIYKLFHHYMQEWYQKRSMRYLEQNTVHIKPPKSFYNDLKTPWAAELTSEINRWSQLNSDLKPMDCSKSTISLENWSYPLPKEWVDMPPHELQPNLNGRLNYLLNEKAKREKELLALANALPEDENKKLLEFAQQIHYAEPLSIDDCIAMALAGESKFQIATLFYLEASLEADHLARAKKELDLIIKNLEDHDGIQKFLENLWTPHHYLPSTSTLPMLISEYYSNCRFRTKPDQALLISLLANDSSENKGCIIQAIMGSGKSKMLAPVWLQMMLIQGFIPIYCVPSSLLRTSISDIQEMMWKRFRTHVRVLAFDRDCCTSDTLHRLAETLYLSRKEPTVFVCATRDIHALQLMLKERHQVIEDMRDRLKRFTLIWSRSCLNDKEQTKFSAALSKNRWVLAETAVPKSYKEQFLQWSSSHQKLEEELKPLIEESSLLQSILNLLQNEAAILVDEVATSYEPNNLLSYPIGWQAQANPLASAIGCKLYFEWLSPYYEVLDLMNNMQSLSKEKIRHNIYCAISQTAWQEYKQLIPNLPQLSVFTAYMLSDSLNGGPMQKFVFALNENPSMMMQHIAQELAYLKYCLTAGLEGALTMIGHVNYGRSKQDPGLYLAIPFQCADVPKENTLFRRPWKTILMTCQHYSQGWNDPKQTAELLGFLQGIDPTSKDIRLIEAALCIWGRRFSDADFSNQKDMLELTVQLDNARLHPEKSQSARMLISTYLNSCVFPNQLKIDPSQLTSSPQDIPMTVAKADGMGGTFGFETTWNPKLKRVPDQSSDATILKALAEKRNQTCHILPKGGSKAFFNHLESGALDGYMALIDAGAHLKGLGNENIAKRLLRALKGFDCILFYDEQPTGGARLAVMTAEGKTVFEFSDKESVRRALSQMKLWNPFTFYDQARRIGADLELKDGRALVTFSDAVTQDDLLQSCMRCRRLLDGRHSVAYAIPQEMEGEWTGDKVIETSKKQQMAVEGKSNFHGICEQLRGEVRAKIDRTMRSIADFSMRHEIYMAASSFLMEEQDNDLVKTFGSLQGMMRSGEALQRLTEHLIDRIEKILPDAKETIKKSLEAILEWHKNRGTILPEFVRDGESQDDAVQEVDLSKDQDRMRLMEEEYERMLGTRNPKKEIAWSKFDPKFIQASPLGTYTNIEGMPTLYTLKDALKERGYSVQFSKNLMISANLLSTFLGETNCLLTENQKPVHRVLYVRGMYGPTAVLVSEGDARYLKEHLLKMPDKNGTCIYLVESSGAINQRGSRSEKIVNLWREGIPEARSLLLQVLIFQGAALLLDKLPVDEVTAALNHWTRKKSDRLTSARLLFEAALDFKPDDMLYYRRNQKLRSLFTQNDKKRTYVEESETNRSETDSPETEDSYRDNCLIS